MNTDAAAHLVARSIDAEDGCRVWTLSTTRQGYGQTKFMGRMHMSHRLSYQTFVGPIPEGLDLDHLCRNRACINPEHLEPVTRSENVRRGANRGRTRNLTPVNFPPVISRTEDDLARIAETVRLLDPKRVRRKDVAAVMAAMGSPVSGPTLSLWRYGHVCPSPENFTALKRAVRALARKKQVVA